MDSKVELIAPERGEEINLFLNEFTDLLVSTNHCLEKTAPVWYKRSKRIYY